MKVRVDQQKWIETEELTDLEYPIPNRFACHLYQSRKGTFIVKSIDTITGLNPSYRLATNEEVQNYLNTLGDYYFNSDEI